MKDHIRILIIEDHEIIVWALTKAIEENFQEVVLYSAPNFEQGFKILEQTPVELIILDIDLPDGNTTKMINKLRKVQSEVRILIHSALPEKEYSLMYLTAGADGFVSKSAPFSMVTESIEVVLKGNKYISILAHEAIAETFFTESQKRKEKKREKGVHLTGREKEVITLLLKGKWTKEIAHELGLKVTTISTHKGNIFQKFRVNNAVGLFKKVQEKMPELLGED